MNINKSDLYCAIKKTIKYPKDIRSVEGIKVGRGIIDIESEYKKYLEQLCHYIELTEKNERIGYFSDSAIGTDIYSYTYYVMTSGLVDYDITSNKEAVAFVLSKAQKEDGLCYDSNLISYRYLNGDGWGARHFIPHYIIAMERLRTPIAHEFKYTGAYKSNGSMKKILNSLDWTDPWGASNFVMNIGVALMYERKTRVDNSAGEAIKELQSWLIENIRPDSGMWGKGDIRSKAFRYLLVRGAYHIFPLLFYDGIDIPYKRKAIDLVLDLQNSVGGFDFRITSSACDDIDAIEPLIRLSLLENGYREKEIRECIEKAFHWVVFNQREDGGCVFSLGQPFCYGDSAMCSKANESNWFGTWFRTLSICYMYDYLTNNKRKYVDLPGMEYPLFR